jgi:hypothetical protein
MDYQSKFKQEEKRGGLTFIRKRRELKIEILILTE